MKWRTSLSAAGLVAGACTGVTATDASTRQTIITLALGGGSQSMVPPGPYVSVIDSVHVTAVPTAGGTVAPVGRRLAPYDTIITLPISVPGGTNAFSVQVLSVNRSTLFSGTTSQSITADGFQVNVQVAAVRPVLVVLPDTQRTSGPSATSFTVYNGGSSSLTWSVTSTDTAIVRCGQACTLAPSQGPVGPRLTGSFVASVPVGFPSRRLAYTVRSAEGDVTAVWQYTAAVVTSVVVSPSASLVQVDGNAQHTATVQSNGSTAVQWRTGDPRLAFVSSNGLATGLSNGSTMIHAVALADSTKRDSALFRVYTPSSPNQQWSVVTPAFSDTVRRDATTGKFTALVQGRVSGPSGIFQNPFALVEFWVRPSAGGPWRRIAQAGAPVLQDNGFVRSFTFSTTWNPSATDAPFANPSVTRVDLIAVGLTAQGVVIGSLLNQTLQVIVP